MFIHKNEHIRFIFSLMLFFSIKQLRVQQNPVQTVR